MPRLNKYGGVTKVEQDRGIANDRYIEDWLKYVTPEKAEYHFNRMLVDQDNEEYSLLKAKRIAQRFNFSDEFVHKAIEPYYSPGEEFCELRCDTYWGDGKGFRPGDTDPTVPSET